VVYKITTGLSRVTNYRRIYALKLNGDIKTLTHWMFKTQASVIWYN
jgi:hypothetical protein